MPDYQTIAQTPVHEVMSNQIYCLKDDAPLPKVLDLFMQLEISGAPVADAEDNYIGVVTRTDLIQKKAFEGMIHSYKEGEKSEELFAIRHYMNPVPPITVNKDDSLLMAVKKMIGENIQRIFVVESHENPTIVGVLSLRDIARLILNKYNIHVNVSKTESA